MILYSLRGLKVAIYSSKEEDIKKLLLGIGILSDTYDALSQRDWQVVITDQNFYTQIPSDYLRIVLADHQLEDIRGHIIQIPGSPDLKALHWSLVEAAEIAGLQNPAYY